VDKTLEIKLSIFSKLLIWFFLNLGLIAVLLVIFFQVRFHFSPDSPLTGPSFQKTHSMRKLLRRELSSSQRSMWNEILEKYGHAFDLELFLYSIRGEKITGIQGNVPEEVLNKIRAKCRCADPSWGSCRKLPPDRRIHNNLGRFDLSGPAGRPGRPPLMYYKTETPDRYWMAFMLPVFSEETGTVLPVILLAATDSLFGAGLFPDPLPWIVTALVVITVSLLWWFPMVRHLTRPLSAMNRVTEEVSRGQFDVRLDTGRSDEIGRLGRSIETMASRLADFVEGRRRFLSDVAHELCSPLARLRMGLGIMENRIEASQRDIFREVSDEVDSISKLVNELLSFSRAELSPEDIKLSSVNLKKTIQPILEREKGTTNVTMAGIDDDMCVNAQPELLSRAVANLVRNAVRYAGESDPIQISAEQSDGCIRINFDDSGPGVPDELLPRIFDPFFRIEKDRGRDTGGAGLGLAIVKTCIESCRGTVSAENLRPAGFRVTIELERSP